MFTLQDSPKGSIGGDTHDSDIRAPRHRYSPSHAGPWTHKKYRQNSNSNTATSPANSTTNSPSRRPSSPSRTVRAPSTSTTPYWVSSNARFPTKPGTAS